jgi:hypothetical protein
LGGGFAGTPEEVWGTRVYDPDKHANEPVVFCGLYGLPDFYALWRHKGPKYIWWCGSDIQHFIKGYWLDKDGEIKICPKGLAKWIQQECESWVENGVERAALASLGINAIITPSYLGYTDIEISYTQSKTPKLYTSVSGDNFELYGWDIIENIADLVPDATFYLYGSSNWKTRHPNVIIRGRVPQEQMDNETAAMQAGLRLVEFDGCSEIVVKSVLRGQHTLSRIPYPFVTTFQNTEELIERIKDVSNTVPDPRAREWFVDNLNKYPWNRK